MNKNYKVVKHYAEFSSRRYSTPWICEMNEDGSYNFKKTVGIYTGKGKSGEAGDTIVFDPVIGQVYGYGQKDYQGDNTEKEYVKWDGNQFIPCDRVGNPKKEA